MRHLARLRPKIKLFPALRALSTAPSPSQPDFNTSPDVASRGPGVSPAQRARKRRRELQKQLKQDGGIDGGLISSTLREMEEDDDFQLTAKRLKEMGQERLTREEKKLRRRALDLLNVPSFDRFLQDQGLELLRRVPTNILQLNIGLFCNQACGHCHVESSPKRVKEQMSREVADACLRLLAATPSVKTVDITGGAPELNAQFRHVVREAHALGREVIDRCNLTVLAEPGQEDLAGFLASHRVRVVASLPCYSPSNVELQRGNGVFNRSIAGLLALNEQGYGIEGSGLELDLVYNPVGAFLPPSQPALEAKYKEELAREFGVTFNSLYTITNMPIKRFADFLHRRGELEQYMELLVRNFNPATTADIMCSDTLSVSWDGRLSDCDFNQQLAMHMKDASQPARQRKSLNVLELSSLDELVGRRVLTGSPVVRQRPSPAETHALLHSKL